MLSRMSLLRNDPDDARSLFMRAREGDMDAQYTLGLAYAEGRGVAIDNSKAFFWLSQALAQGDDDARVLRNIVARDMTDPEHRAARRMRDQPGTIRTIEL